LYWFTAVLRVNAFHLSLTFQVWRHRGPPAAPLTAFSMQEPFEESFEIETRSDVEGKLAIVVALAQAAPVSSQAEQAKAAVSGCSSSQQKEEMRVELARTLYPRLFRTTESGCAACLYIAIRVLLLHCRRQQLPSPCTTAFDAENHASAANGVDLSGFSWDLQLGVLRFGKQEKYKSALSDVMIAYPPGFQQYQAREIIRTRTEVLETLNRRPLFDGKLTHQVRSNVTSLGW
jgi:hypothetical protein